MNVGQDSFVKRRVQFTKTNTHSIEVLLGKISFSCNTILGIKA